MIKDPNKHQICCRKSLLKKVPQQAADAMAFEDHRKQYLEIFRKLRAENPDLSIDELSKLATDAVVAHAPKSRAFYRIQATHKMMGAGDLLAKSRKKSNSIAANGSAFMPDKPKQVIVE
jgi:solute carrier family 8 (sodium/calcium exchanger)